ncbi:MAG: hypothetical protein B7Y55_01115 [Polynucleobacter sp. 35-46-207]|jgi:hypothetical protein|nr:MAG: hypothetical protein B7Y55_01115 [Polynucleobacter sp. 35-46-207]OZB49411.1 MAG: hypothetical protein B7X60_01225 [Polynucleobacter sp. 39-45-136]
MSQNIIVNVSGNNLNMLNITAATVVKAFPGKIVNVNVTTAGTTVGSVSDIATTAGVAAANLVASIPNAVGSYPLNFPCKVGIVITPGTGQVISVSYN